MTDGCHEFPSPERAVSPNGKNARARLASRGERGRVSGGPVVVLLDHADGDGGPLGERPAIFPWIFGPRVRPDRVVVPKRLLQKGALGTVAVGPAGPIGGSGHSLVRHP